RARRTMRSHPASPRPHQPAGTRDEAIVARDVDAHHRGDAAPLPPLVATHSRRGMPPAPPCRRTHQAGALFRQVLGPDRPGDWKLVPTRANGAPATANYLLRPGDTAFRATSLDVLQVDDGRVATITCFLGDRLFPAFGLPPTQPA